MSDMERWKVLLLFVALAGCFLLAAYIEIPY